MADSTLANYFSVDPSSTIWGAGQNALVAALPAFQTPGQGYSQNFASAMGASLLSALLGYQATRSANQQSLEAAGLGSQLMRLQTPEERLGFIKGVDSSLVQDRLLGLNTALTERELMNELAAKQKLNDLTTAANFELGPLGTQLYQRDLQKELPKRTILGGEPKMPTLPSGVQDKIVDASTFAEIAQEHRNRIAKMSPAELKTLLTTGTNFFGLVGEPGFLQENEATLQLYRKANFGATLTGQEKKAADIISGKSLTATKEDIIAAWDTLINQSQRRAQRAIEVATNPVAAAQQMSGKSNAGGGGEDPMKAAAQKFLTDIQSKYGTEWKAKATAEERDTAKALLKAAGR